MVDMATGLDDMAAQIMLIMPGRNPVIRQWLLVATKVRVRCRMVDKMMLLSIVPALDILQ